MNKKQRLEKIHSVLKGIYPDSECMLEYGNDPFRLLVMGMLSAQCTDITVNRTSPGLFSLFPDCFAMKDAELGAIEEAIKPCGLYRTKAKNIKEASRILCERFGGEVPSDMESLLSLPGVGRKIANLIRSDLFGLPAIVADTHCIRVSSRWGFTDEDNRDPLVTEKEMMKIAEPEESGALCHRIVFFGRDYCTARNPKCGICPVYDHCRYSKKGDKDEKKG